MMPTSGFEGGAKKVLERPLATTSVRRELAPRAVGRLVPQRSAAGLGVYRQLCRQQA